MNFFIHEGELFFTCTKKGICCYQFFNFLLEEVLEQSENFVISPVFYFWDEEQVYKVLGKDVVDKFFVKVAMTPKLKFKIKKIASEEGLPIYIRNIFRHKVVNFSLASIFDSFSGCPYLSEGLCSIRENRPFACRIYPVIFANILLSVDEDEIPLSSQCKNCDGVNAYSPDAGAIRLSDVKREARAKLMDNARAGKKLTARIFATLKKYGVFEEVMANYILDDIRTFGYVGETQTFNAFVYKAFVESFFENEEEKRLFLENQIRAIDRELNRLLAHKSRRWQTNSAIDVLYKVKNAAEEIIAGYTG